MEPFTTRLKGKLNKENSRQERLLNRGVITGSGPFNVNEEYGNLFAPAPQEAVPAPPPQMPAPAQNTQDSWAAGRDAKLNMIAEMGAKMAGNPEIDSMLMSAYLEILMSDAPSKTDDLASAFQLTQDPYFGQALTNSLYGDLGVDPTQMDAQNAMQEQFKSDFAGIENAPYLSQAGSNPNIINDYYSDLTADREENNFLQNWFNNPNSRKNRETRIQEILSNYANS